MSYKLKTQPTSDIVTCEKYFNKMLRNDRLFSTKKSPANQEKFSGITKQPSVLSNQRPKAKSSTRQQSPIPKPSPIVISKLIEHGDCVTSSESPKVVPKKSKIVRGRSVSRERESWGQLLHKSRSRETISGNFSSFDPLRTIHFLSKELQSKLKDLLPEEENVMQMIADIQQAVKRIPSELSILLKQIEAPSKTSQDSEKYSFIIKAPGTNKSCQTPPTLYQEDTEKFQKIMAENTARLEASCKQLEVVCTRLQDEKEMTERELEEARESVELLCKKIKDLEFEMEQLTSVKLKQLESEKSHLQQELDKAMQEIKNNPTVEMLKKHIEELQVKKSRSDEHCAKLEYEMTLLKMEKEKFVTMLSVRDREIKDIQEEMFKIQEQVNKQLEKLNAEMLPRLKSVKSLTDPLYYFQDNYMENKDITLSSVNTAESEKESGDAALSTVTQNHNHIKTSVPTMTTEEKKDSEYVDEFFEGLSPSAKSLLTSN